MDITKKNGDICYNDENHCYWNANDEDLKYISVTTLIHSFEQPFNKEFYSALKALELLIPKDRWQMEKKSLLSSKRFDKKILDLYDISENDFNREQQRILDEWEESNRSARERGTKMHADLERSFYDTDINLTKFGIGGKLTYHRENTASDLQNGVYPEYLINYSSDDKMINIAGQADLLIKDNNDIYIIDHKFTKDIKTKGYYDQGLHNTQKMLYPVNHLDNCNYNLYQLQLSFYAFMIESQNEDYHIKDLMINHYDYKGNNTLYHCDYLKDDVKRILDFYRKKLIRDQKRERRKPIVY